MIRYLRDENDRLTRFKGGMEKHTAKWAGNELTPVIIQDQINLLDAKEKQIEETKTLLNQQQMEAKILQQAAVKLGDQVENFINGFHSNEPEKLLDYGLEPRKSYTKKQAPVTKPQISIQDDYDGEGFILTTQSDPDAEMYEWYKGIGADPTKPDLTPAMTLLKTTKKTSFVDDDVVKGMRVFYKVRVTNSKGDGPWSEAVSKVQ